MEIAVLRSRILIALTALVSAGLCWLASRAFGIPPVDGLDISLLNGHSPVLAMMVVAIAFIGCTSLGALVVGRSSTEAGLFVAAVGLAVFSVRGGSISTTLRYAATDGIFIKLAIELVLLYAIVTAAILVNAKLAGRSAKAADDDDEIAPPLSHYLMALGVQGVTMVILMLLLGQSESKKQAMATVGIAAYLGSIAAHYTFPVKRGEVLMFGPLVVGLIGYFLERSQPALATIGLVEQPLAIALPIELVSAGLIGGILGHWMSQKWARESEQESPVAAAPTPAPTAE